MSAWGLLVGACSSAPTEDAAADDEGTAAAATENKKTPEQHAACTCTAETPVAYDDSYKKPAGATVGKKMCRYACDCTCSTPSGGAWTPFAKTKVIGEGYTKLVGPELYSWNNEQQCYGQRMEPDPQFPSINKAFFDPFQRVFPRYGLEDDPAFAKRILEFCSARVKELSSKPAK